MSRAVVDVLPDELVSVSCRPRIATASADEDLAALFGESGDLAGGKSGQESLRG